MTSDNSDESLDKVKQMAKIMKEIAPHFKAMGKSFSDLSDLSKTVSEQARDQLTTSDKISISVSRIIGKTENLSSLISNTNGFIKNITKGGMASWLAIIEASVERWIDLDRAAAKFRLETGLVSSQMVEIRKSVELTNVQFVHMGVTLDKAYESAKNLYLNFQSSKLVTGDMIRDTSLLEANLGISSKHTARFASLFSEVSKASGYTATKLVGATAALSKMAGVAPNEVMDDIANASERTYMFLAKNPIQLIRASIEARRLGSTIKSISESARGMLNFQESITAEMEASALLGVNVNFQLARQLAFEKDIIGSRKEALRQIELAGNFTDMNVYQQESLAKAANMTVDEIIKQQNQQKMLNALERERPELYKKYNEMQQAARKNEKTSTESLVKNGEEMMKQMEMQAEMDKLTNALKSAWVDVGNALLPIANVIMPAIVGGARVLSFLSKLIVPLLVPLGAIYQSGKMISDIFLSLAITFPKLEKLFIGASTVANVFGLSIAKIGNAFGVISGWVGKLGSAFKIVGQGISVFGKFSGFLSPFLKFLPVIGWVITGIQVMTRMIGKWVDIFNDPSMNVGQKIWAGIVAVGDSLYDVLIKPFVDVWQWLKKTLMGNSPSELGLGIVRGIKSVGNMLFEALLWPFNKLMGVLSKLPIIGKMFGGAKDIVNSLNPFSDQNVDVSSSTTKIENMDVLVDSIRKLTDVISASRVTHPIPSNITKSDVKSTGVEARLDELISLLKNGAIGVSIDGRKISQRIAVSSGT